MQLRLLTKPVAMRSEAAVQADARLAYDALGWRISRNNVGVLLDKRGVPVRYGLWNETAALNHQVKSSDLIGWRPRLITPDMVGEVIAQFVARECKPEGWTLAPPTDRARYAHEQAQQRFIDMLNADGGDGAFETGAGN